MTHSNKLRHYSVYFCLMIALGLVGRDLAAQTYSESQQVQDSSGSVIGTLQYTVNETSGTCPTSSGYPPAYGSWVTMNYETFQFTETTGHAAGASFPLGGSGEYVQSPGGSYCPTPGTFPSSSITLTGGYGFSIQFDICGNTTCSATLTDVPAGYVSPKYIVATLAYAPPGLSSTATYGSSLETGNTTSTSSSWKSTVTTTETFTSAINIATPFHGGKLGLGGKQTNTATQQSSESQGNSSTFTTDLKTTSSFQTPGMPPTWTGWWASGFNPHDYDWPWLWLNAVLPFEAPTISSNVWYGYAWDACDPVVGMDIYEVMNGYLENGGGGVPSAGIRGLNSADLQELGRGWATNPQTYISSGQIPSDCDGQTFASGDSPALSTTDYANILTADPVRNQSYALNLQSPSYITTGDGRYTRASAFIDVATGQVTQNQQNTNFPFVQAGCVGCSPPSEAFGATYTATSDIGTSQDYQVTQTYGVDNSFSGSLWLANFDSEVSTSNSVTSDYSSKTDFTNSTSNYGTFTIVGPPCNSGGSPCSPSYAGPASFNVYQDNKFGTFMFWPLQ